MRKLIFIISLVSLAAVAANANSNCPKNLAGDWMFKAVGMPDGGEETGGAMTVTEVRGSDGVITGYLNLFSHDYSVDNVYRRDNEMSSGPGRGSHFDYYKRSRCEDGKLITDWVNHLPTASAPYNFVGSDVLVVDPSGESFTQSQALNTETIVGWRKGSAPPAPNRTYQNQTYPNDKSP